MGPRRRLARLVVAVSGLRGPVGWCRAMVAPRQRVSCRRGTGRCGGGEPNGGAGPVLGDWASRRHRNLDAADADAHERAEIRSGPRWVRDIKHDVVVFFAGRRKRYPLYRP